METLMIFVAIYGILVGACMLYAYVQFDADKEQRRASIALLYSEIENQKTEAKTLAEVHNAISSTQQTLDIKLIDLEQRVGWLSNPKNKAN